MQSTSLFQELNVTTTGTLAVNNFTSTVSGTLMVNAVNATDGGQVYGKSYTLTGIKIQNQTMSRGASFLLSVPISPYPLTSDLTLTAQHNTTQHDTKQHQHVQHTKHKTVSDSKAPRLV